MMVGNRQVDVYQTNELRSISLFYNYIHILQSYYKEPTSFTQTHTYIHIYIYIYINTIIYHYTNKLNHNYVEIK